jgi:hypothetical protein
MVYRFSEENKKLTLARYVYVYKMSATG